MSDDDELPFRPGDVVAGKYRVERVLGAGGMGYVIAARHLQLDQLVAMKFLRKGACESKEASTRFLREAKAVVKLRNEHVAKVFDVGTLEGDEPYIVMEYLEGYDLATLANERHDLPVAEACEYVMQACEALAEAHRIGIIHRDIKPANLFVTRGPAGGPLLKVLDFGISKTNPFGESEHDMTRSASMLGSPRFMSPEQMRDARAVDARTDIWSLGVVLYRLVAGHPPFEAETLGRLLSMVMHEREPPMSATRADLPPGFEAVVARCLEKETAKRYSNVAELAYALAPFAADPVQARSSADRIAAVLSMTAPPKSGDFTGPLPLFATQSGRSNAAPAAGDSGTASPWTGTPVAEARPKSTLATFGLAAALVAMLLGSASFAVLRRDRQGAEAAARAVEPATSVEATPAVPPSAPEGALAAPVDAPPLPTTTSLPPPPSTGTPTDKPTPNSRRGAPRTKTPSTPSAPHAPTTRVKPDGIPATRD